MIMKQILNAFGMKKKIQNYICLEDQFDYCFRKNITIEIYYLYYFL
jgi:hypothetical protein